MSSESCPMIGGVGPRSHSRNSSYQRGVMEIAKEAINQSIKANVDLSNHFFGTSSIFRVADFGCSVGPNTFDAMHNLIQVIDAKYHQQHHNPPPLEFQLFFNDLVGNDFNTLFKSIPSNKKYFAAGVPGSFHSRLFPESSVHVGFTSYSLHWLSKVPEEIVDRSSPAWNKGSIQCTGLNKEVANAYLGQFKHDMKECLSARAQEIVSGRLMVILIAVRPNGIPLSQTMRGAFYDMFGSCLIDAANTVIDSFHFAPKK